MGKLVDMTKRSLTYPAVIVYLLSFLVVGNAADETSMWRAVPAVGTFAIAAEADDNSDGAGANAELKFPDEPPNEPDDYRMGHYRGLVPLTLKGATVLSNKQAMKLYKTGKVKFVDVMPHTPKPPNLPEGTIWRGKKRRNIPDSTWLANVGYGHLPPEMAHYFKNNLAKISEGDKERKLVFYCQEECWMSWNAAKRALEYGYKSVYWYPEGTDGWVKIGGKVVSAKPVTLPQMTRRLSH